MKTDTLFYNILKKLPFIFYELIGRSAEDAKNYTFYAPDVKQASDHLDGVYLPQIGDIQYPINFVEVQFQKDTWFYACMFAEIFSYLYQEKILTAWVAVVVFPSRSREAEVTQPYHRLLDRGCIYLVEISNQEQKFWGLNVLRYDGKDKIEDTELRQELFVLVETIIVYKYPERRLKK